MQKLPTAGRQITVGTFVGLCRVVRNSRVVRNVLFIVCGFIVTSGCVFVNVDVRINCMSSLLNEMVETFVNLIIRDSLI